MQKQSNHYLKQVKCLKVLTATILVKKAQTFEEAKRALEEKAQKQVEEKQDFEEAKNYMMKEEVKVESEQTEKVQSEEKKIQIPILNMIAITTKIVINNN